MQAADFPAEESDEVTVVEPAARSLQKPAASGQIQGWRGGDHAIEASQGQSGGLGGELQDEVASQREADQTDAGVEERG